jgi:bifunctional DNA-binding transcriptional regulator/antitoxin component of YhaV-PrlF toxin-antitoxin module
VLKVRGAASVGLTVPADVARRMGLDVGDRVVVAIRKA